MALRRLYTQLSFHSTLMTWLLLFGVVFVFLYLYWIQDLFFNMFGSRLLSIFAVFIACAYCGKRLSVVRPA